MEVKNLLPIGTVVELEKAEKKMMIVGIMVKDSLQEGTRDYIAVTYPEGYINRNIFFQFDQKDIIKVVHYGYESSERQEFLGKIDGIKKGEWQ